jgi:nicotinamide-nucleotide amidase
MKNIDKLVKNIIDELTKQKKTISFAESCTGGRIAAEFTAISGASNVLNGSCITYSNKIKHQWLGVSQEVLENFGAVSEECVSQMLEGIQKMAKSNYAIAVSGIAGPTGGTEEKPVGTVYIGIITPYGKEIFHCIFNGSRENIQELSTLFAIKKLAKSLNFKEISKFP